MTIFDLVLILAVLGCILALITLCYFLLRRRWTRAKRVLLVLGSFLVVYTAVLLSVSLHLALVVTHGLFPDVLVIGSEQSFLHKPTIVPLQMQ